MGGAEIKKMEKREKSLAKESGTEGGEELKGCLGISSETVFNINLL